MIDGYIFGSGLQEAKEARMSREPSQAAAYLRSVGLAGSFWGL